MRRYWIVAACLGGLAVWGSEAAFWVAPPAGIDLLEVAVTWVAYTICTAATLTVLLLTGVQGWRAAFLGGAVLGWLVEGAVVSTMYAAPPFQLVWTPLAWHALVTGLLVVGGGRASATWSVRRQLALWVLLGGFIGLFGWYWPLEGNDVPGLVATVTYLLGVGLAVPVAHLILDRLAVLERPRSRWIYLAPGLLGLAWLARVVVVPSPIWLLLPLVLLPTWWVMRRLGSPDPGPLVLGASPRSRWHRMLPLTAPLVGAAVASWGWQTFPDGVETNVPVAAVTCLVSLVLLGRLVREARRAHRPAITPARVPSSP